MIRAAVVLAWLRSRSVSVTENDELGPWIRSVTKNMYDAGELRTVSIANDAVHFTHRILLAVQLIDPQGERSE